jgi:hypothetical protein
MAQRFANAGSADACPLAQRTLDELLAGPEVQIQDRFTQNLRRFLAEAGRLKCDLDGAVLHRTPLWASCAFG